MGNGGSIKSNVPKNAETSRGPPNQNRKNIKNKINTAKQLYFRPNIQNYSNRGDIQSPKPPTHENRNYQCSQERVDNQQWYQPRPFTPHNDYQNREYQVPVQNSFQPLVYQGSNDQFPLPDPFLGYQGNGWRGGRTPRCNSHPSRNWGRGRGGPPEPMYREDTPFQREGEGAGQGHVYNPRKRRRDI